MCEKCKKVKVNDYIEIAYGDQKFICLVKGIGTKEEKHNHFDIKAIKDANEIIDTEVHSFDSIGIIKDEERLKWAKKILTISVL